MKETVLTNVREDDKLRASFNALTQKTFWFDFTDWYARGHWQDKYIPHVIVKDDKVVANVSVNIMDFRIHGEIKHFIQLGTVMTDDDYRGQGLNRQIMESILEEYKGKVDGIYLFGNDEVLEFYPKFGFQPAEEYEYFKTVQKDVPAYKIEKVNMEDKFASEKLYEVIRTCATNGAANDGFFMCDNLGLFQFWLAENEGVYYFPEMDAYVVAETDGEKLLITQMFGKKEIDMDRVAVSIGELEGTSFEELLLGYTPSNKEGYSTRVHKEEDCTLFIIGEDLEEILQEKVMFPILSHA